MYKYKDPVNNITQYQVYKSGSLSTQVYLFPHSSFQNCKTNMDDLSVKGPNTLHNHKRFKNYEKALSFDITKAYSSIKTGQSEIHLRRL